MTDQQIKEFVSKRLLKNIPDYALQTVLRRVLYSDKNRIDWQDFYQQALDQMPELTLEVEESVKASSVMSRILEGASVREVLSESNSINRSIENWWDNTIDSWRTGGEEFFGFDPEHYTADVQEMPNGSYLFYGEVYGDGSEIFPIDSFTEVLTDCGIVPGKDASIKELSDGSFKVDLLEITPEEFAGKLD